MPPLYTYFAPPLVGAFIGYMTNYVAIRMLFRPLKPWHLFMIRIPMTPGVIPSKRHELAVNIGRMVGDHLLTATDVQKALGEEAFRKELHSLISTRVGHFFGRDLGPLPSLVPVNFQDYFKAGIRIMRWRTLKHLHNHLDSEEFARSLSGALAERLDEILAGKLDQALPPEMVDRFMLFIGETAGDLLSSPEVEQWLTGYLDHKLAALLEEGRSPADLVPADLYEQTLNALERETPALLQKLAAMIQEPVMRDRIAGAICRVIDNFIASLGPMAALVGNFIRPEVIQEKIQEYLVRKGNDLSQWLFDEKVQLRVAQTLRRKGDEFLHRPLNELLKNVPPEKIDRGRVWLAERILNVLRDPATARALHGIIRESVLARRDLPLSDTITAVFGPEGTTQAKQWATDEILSLARSKNFKRLLDRLVIEMTDDKLLQTPIGRLEDFLPRKVQESINDFLLDQAGDILVKEVPGLVESLKISEIVTRKVDSLDLLRLEGLLMSIMQEQFKYINLFGGLLGFIIGLLNLFVLFTVN
ncbi:MAG: DUF445 family protein [Proteobacteria bacterium]|nr:DUF445 family protein [Pseudomonadota bacterium]MBU1739697.1 DUF445 family protein [Pseudomonadota bacterium]